MQYEASAFTIFFNLFSISSKEHLIQAMSGFIDEAEIEEISRLTNLCLPPITSELTLAVMLGVNPGLIWSFLNNPKRHYNSFQIPSNKKMRIITAPRVALKVCQKWLSFRFQIAYQPADHVFGFVSGRSHVGAAAVHCGAKWIFSVDIKDFFQSTPLHEVVNALQHLGYGEKSRKLLGRLCCFRGYLSQGSPTSPIISNIVLRRVDEELLCIARKHKLRLTRYADDIVFSGVEAVPFNLQNEVVGVFETTPWRLAKDKILFMESPR